MNFTRINTDMFKVRKLSLVAILTILLVSCDDFGDMNMDPNNPSEVRTELLLTNAQRSISDVVGATTGTLYVQYLAETQYTDASEYSNIIFNFNFWYTNPLQDLETIIRLNSNEDTRDEVLSGGSNANQIATARILKVYFYHMMTDRWGMIPYSEALQGNENLRPSYDDQSFIYEDLINELKEAVAQIDSGPGVNGDILFDGDMQRWVEFANSLRMRIAMRMSDVNESLASSEFADAYNSGMISEDVMYPYLAEAANENPWFSRFRTRTDYALSDVMADAMKPLQDYRVLKFGDPAPDVYDEGTEITFDDIVGMPYDAENAGEITNSSISFPGQAIREQDAPLPIITLAELHLSIAEAIERGWISGDASQYYEDAIEASWRQWDVYDPETFADYLSQPEIAYDSAEWVEKIGFQKWIALFPLGYEAWSEWRRLGVPELTPHPFAQNDSGQIPRRHAYPTSELELNGESYEAAVNAQGPDHDQTRLWWDVN